MTWTDGPLPEDAAIAAAHPMRSGSHDTYAEAMRMVGAKQSKGSLVELVNWLLVQAKSARAEIECANVKLVAAAAVVTIARTTTDSCDEHAGNACRVWCSKCRESDATSAALADAIEEYDTARQ